jgi:hypothetical protein
MPLGFRNTGKVFGNDEQYGNCICIKTKINSIQISFVFQILKDKVQKYIMVSSNWFGWRFAQRYKIGQKGTAKSGSGGEVTEVTHDH